MDCIVVLCEHQAQYTIQKKQVPDNEHSIPIRQRCK